MNTNDSQQKHEQQGQSQTNQTLANTADIAILLFCLSAIGPHPSTALARAARHVMDMLKPGGILILRDYGRLDEAQMKLGTSDKELGHNFYRKGDGTGCYYFELDDLKELFVNNHDDDDTKLELLELDYIQRVYRNRGDGTTRRRVWVQGRFRKPYHRVSSDEEDDCKAPCVDAPSKEDNVMEQFLATAAQRWDDYYKHQSSTTYTTTPSLPSNLLQMFPMEFQPWQQQQQHSRGKGKRQKTPPPQQEQPTERTGAVTVIDLGCGLGNNTLLDILEKQQSPSSSSSSSSSLPSTVSKPPILNVHFVDISKEAILKMRDDSRYKRCTIVSKEEESAEEVVPTNHATDVATVTSHVCNLALPLPLPSQATTISSSSTAAPLLLKQSSADFILLLFTLSSIGSYPSSAMRNAVQNAVSMLKPGGVILFRDYGRYDDLQLQLNSVVGAQLCDNFYVGDLNIKQNHDDETSTNSVESKKGVGCYFFDINEVRDLFATTAGLEVLELEYITRIYKKKKSGSKNNGRNCTQNDGGAVERRRIWIHGRFRKPSV